MRSVLIVLATAVTVSLLACGVAVADTVTTDFEAFHTGTVNGQSGWKSAPPGAIPSCDPHPTGGRYDQAVVGNGLAPSLGFGAQSLRMSNLCGSFEFFYQTYSTPVVSPAGENRENKAYDARFQFISKRPNIKQGRLFISVSPDSYEGSRMSWVGLEDGNNGIHVTISDTPDVDGEFVDYDAGVLDRAKPHTIRFWIKVNPGVDNDVVRIFIDGNDVGQGLGKCFTTWENYYRTSPEQEPPPNVNNPASINSLQFRSSVRGSDDLEQTGGYLFDNVTTTTASGPGPAAGCGDEPPPIVIDKKPQTQVALPGDTITYRIGVRNRGGVPVRGLRACDRVPRALRFVGASVRLRRGAGRRLCRTIRLLQPGQRKTFRATFQLRANVTADTVTNGAIADIPAGSAPTPSPPDSGVLPAQERRRVARDRATIRVRRPEACASAVNPRAHATC
jgi:uncharacterized repeat protein (TIGR01451 family)